MKKLFFIALRIFTGIFFLAGGLLHFYYPVEMAVYVPLPSGAISFVYFNGALITFSAIAILMDKWINTALMVIGCTLAISAGLVQLGIEWRNPDEIIRPVGISNIIKLLLASLVFIGIIIRLSQNKKRL